MSKSYNKIDIREQEKNQTATKIKQALEPYIKTDNRIFIEGVLKGNNGDIRGSISSCEKEFDLLHMAAEHNADEIGLFLINNGARVNKLNKDGHTPLHVALNCSAIDFVKMIAVERGNVNINIKGYNDIRQLHSIWQKNSSNAHILKDIPSINPKTLKDYLIVSMPTDQDGGYYSKMSQFMDIAKYYIQGANPPYIQAYPYEIYYNTLTHTREVLYSIHDLLLAAIKHNKEWDCIKLLTQYAEYKGKYSENQDGYNSIPSKPEGFEAEMKNLEIFDENNHTILKCIFEHGNLNMLAELVKHKDFHLIFNKGTLLKDIDDNLLCHQVLSGCVKYGDLNILQKFIEEIGLDQNEGAMCIILAAAALYGHEDKVQYITSNYLETVENVFYWLIPMSSYSENSPFRDFFAAFGEELKDEEFGHILANAINMLTINGIALYGVDYANNSSDSEKELVSEIYIKGDISDDFDPNYLYIVLYNKYIGAFSALLDNHYPLSLIENYPNGAKSIYNSTNEEIDNFLKDCKKIKNFKDIIPNIEEQLESFKDAIKNLGEESQENW